MEIQKNHHHHQICCCYHILCCEYKFQNENQTLIIIIGQIFFCTFSDFHESFFSLQKPGSGVTHTAWSVRSPVEISYVVVDYSKSAFSLLVGLEIFLFSVGTFSNTMIMIYFSYW